MSISKRLIDLARANLTDFREAFSADRLRDLLDHDDRRDLGIEGSGSGSGSEDGGDGDGSAKLETDETLGRKAGRRAREVREAAEDAWQRAYENARQRAGVRGQPPSDPAGDRRRWYRTLELEPGSDLKAVRRAYRKLLLQYHPDRHATDPEKYKAATEVTRKLTEAYNGLTRHLGG